MTAVAAARTFEWQAVVAMPAARDATATAVSEAREPRAGATAGPRDPAGDAALLARMAAGDQRALAVLVSRHGGALRSFATRFLGSAVDAEEVVQDVFLRAWTHAARFRPDLASPSTWLYRIAVNRCIDVRRGQALRRFFGWDDALEEVASDAPDPLRELAGRDALGRARGAIRALPDRQRMALLLSVVTGLDNGEIGAAMALSRGGVEQLLVRARRTLRARLDADGIERVTPEDGREA
ncbi:RNA polymerase sigma factor [Mangrovibrevibacter kandeliae]|uniref:RNA polymerase sigma factor n=1 Tax=Mangrovibrevibacter kandeliae TaxID=2968473 RepID=UPI002119907A|nr:MULTISPECIES: sigma-70 family RNA polymerase sigma factor [unclassified Aurantimonas]MCQ8784197.1 sigma-70 family RNA polymerase sigma factor [Aurantimonas sp. CSK15Z-1]MCW4116961.1 sigma-70 family RNA polymerase sigma factor [Aurantimonas sp. MSK8Z-1]